MSWNLEENLLSSHVNRQNSKNKSYIASENWISQLIILQTEGDWV